MVDGIGCKSDCTGSLPGWSCTSGSIFNSISVCISLWGLIYSRL
ncbi:MAG: hypothetical protein IPK55_12535 [Streptococcus sp.]|nr:hypothetical protein [Streptococcus sp.]